MAAARIALNGQQQFVADTAHTLIVPGDGVEIVWVLSSADLHFEQRAGLVDDAAVAATARARIVADVDTPIEVVPGLGLGVAAITGTAEVHLRGTRR